MAVTTLRPTSIAVTGNPTWEDDGTLTTPKLSDTIGAHDTTTWYESPVYDSASQNSIRSSLVCSFTDQTFIPDWLQVRTVAKRVDGADGYLCLTIELRVKVEILGEETPNYSRETVIFQESRIFSSTDTEYVELLSRFDLKNILYREDYSGYEVHYHLCGGGSIDVDGNYISPKISNATDQIRITSVAVEIEDLASTPHSPPALLGGFGTEVSTFSPPSIYDIESLIPYNVVPFRCAASQVLVGHTPVSFYEAYGFVGDIQQLKDPYGFYDQEAGAVKSLYSDQTIRLGVVFDGPGLETSTNEQFLNIRWSLRNSTDGTDLPRNFNVRFELRNPNTGDWDFAGLTNVMAPTQQTHEWSSLHFRQPIPGYALKIRVLIWTDEDEADDWDFFLTSMSMGMCCDEEADAVASPPVPLTDQPGSPPTTGDDTVEVVEGSGSSGCPIDWVPTLPDGSEMLRPNRDIKSILFGPNPIWLQINDSVSAPCDGMVSAPCEYEPTDPDTGLPTGTLRASFEVGFTAPTLAGPFKAVTMRVLAARSRAKPPETGPTMPDTTCLIPQTSCPANVTVKPNEVTYNQDWFSEPIYQSLDEDYWNADECYATTQLTTEAPLKKLTLRFPTPTVVSTDHSVVNGWRSVTIALSARIRDVQPISSTNVITSVGGNEVSLQRDDLYHVRWEPKNCEGTMQVSTIDRVTATGIGIIRSNVDGKITVSMPTNDPSVEVLVSSDGITYDLFAEITINSWQVSPVYWKIRINRMGETAGGTYVVGFTGYLEGNDFVTESETVAGSLLLEVQDSYYTYVPSNSQARLKIHPEAFALANLPTLLTPHLTSSFQTYSLKWFGPWSADLIEEMKLAITPELLSRDAGNSVVEINYLSAEFEPFCPGVSDPVPELTDTCQTILVPHADVSNSNWTETPLWSKLLNNPDYPNGSSFVYCTANESNSFAIQMRRRNYDPERVADPTDDATFDSMSVRIAARKTPGSTYQVYLAIHHNYGETKYIGPLTDQITSYDLEWTFSPEITLNELDMLELTCNGIVAGNGTGDSTLEIHGISGGATCTEPTVVTPPAPSGDDTLLDCRITGYPTSVEVFSCGSLRNCGETPSKVSFSFHAYNDSADDGLLEVMNLGNVDISVTGGTIQTLNMFTDTEYDVSLQVGSEDDPYPTNSMSGIIRLQLTCTGGLVVTKDVTWYYKGNV